MIAFLDSYILSLSYPKKINASHSPHFLITYLSMEMEACQETREE